MAAAYSSSNPARKKLYDVFINFRGEDTRNIFTDHLYKAFAEKKIKAYLDDERLEKGAEISSKLMKAIEESKISVVILSKNFATSSWCLEELRHILQCKETDEQIVVPIFYHVDPSHVRKQQESYAAAFTDLEQRFHEEMDKVQQWRKALTAVSNLSGWDSSVFKYFLITYNFLVWIY